MRVFATAGSASAAARSVPRRGTGGGFSLTESGGTSTARSASGPHSIASLDALIALQAVENPSERRERTLKRGRNLLDVLDLLKVELLGGQAATGALGKLQALAQAANERSGDPRLDEVMAAIELRVAVELAKFASRAA